MVRCLPWQAGDTLTYFDDKTFNWGDLAANNVVPSDSESTGVDSEAPGRMKNGFLPRLFWGSKHVLPRVEASGRWENLPVCRPPEAAQDVAVPDGGGRGSRRKQRTLIACLWASASFTTRGNAQAVSDTTVRLIEWIEFHLLVGFEHIYVYDNTGAHTNETSLESTLFPRFSDSEVTRIDWVSLPRRLLAKSLLCQLVLMLSLFLIPCQPCRVCNNNIRA